MKNRNKNKYILFVFSCLPGAAEMYMGLMHMGSSLLAMFFCGFGVAIEFSGMDGLLFIPALLWFYGFFHARNLAACDEETFDKVEDVYIWEEFFGERTFRFESGAARKWGGVFLLLGGFSLLWESVSDTVTGLFASAVPDYWIDARYQMVTNILSVVPRAVLSLLLIVLGIRLIRGRKQALTAELPALPEKTEDGHDE